MFAQLEPLRNRDWGTPRAFWTSIDAYKIYVRRGCHLFRGKSSWWLDLASIDRPQHTRSKGKLAPFMDTFENSARSLKLRGVHVECVHNQRLAQWLIRRGYTQDGMSYFRELDAS